MKFPEKLYNNLLLRKKHNSYRELYSQEGFIDFSSNDYLGFSKNTNIYERVNAHLKTLSHLNGSTGSRLLTGNHKLHIEVENDLAAFFNSSSALIFNSGYDANVGLLSSIPQHGDTVLFDELCHASIRDGIRLAHAKNYSFKHNDLNDLERKYTNTQKAKGNTYIVIESIYSMDGNAAELVELVKFCDRYQCYLIVDEAHATGLFGDCGRGLVGFLGLENHVFARVHTFGKALGCHGAAVLGSIELREVLINYARSFIYTTAMPLHNVLTIKYAIKELSQTDCIEQLRINIDLFKKYYKAVGLEEHFILSPSAIQSFLVSDPDKAKELGSALRRAQFDVKAILSPTVRQGSERLRFCIHSYNSSKEIKEVLKLLSTFV